jgi:PAS domain S-box-containing protein
MLDQEEIQELFGKVVRNERKKQNLTQSELAERANLDNTYISQIERGLTNPSMFTIHKIAWSLNLSEFSIIQKIKGMLSESPESHYDSEDELELIYNAVGNLNASIILTANQMEDFRIIYCNDAFLKLTNNTRTDLMGKKLQDILSDGENNEVLGVFLDSLDGATSKSELITNHNKIGKNKGLKINVSSVLNSSKKVENHLFTLRDIDQPVDGNDGSYYPVIEKYKTLLKETHHRIKNNLSIIIGIIDVSMLDTKDEDLKSILKDTQLRISSIAHVHEMLLEPSENENVKVKEYLEKLIEIIENTYQLKDIIEMSSSIDELDLEEHQILSLGLLCNELITNSYKYAFDHIEESKILITIKESGPDKISFSYGDNGKGFKRELFEEAKTLGLSLIHVFLEELKAFNVEVDTENKFHLSFEIENRAIS